jgi:hypothetical protein
MSAKKHTTRIEYRPIFDFPGYRVGNDGSVWSAWKRQKKKGHHGFIFVLGETWNRMRTSPNSRYQRVTLCRDGKGHLQIVHRLVLEAFVGPCPPGLMGLHRNDDRSNNSLSNLYWGTPLQNMADCRRNGTKVVGEAVCNAKLTDELVIEMREEYARGGVHQAQLAKKYQMTQVNVSAVVTGKSWAHVGGPITRLGRAGSNRLRAKRKQ